MPEVQVSIWGISGIDSTSFVFTVILEAATGPWSRVPRIIDNLVNPGAAIFVPRLRCVSYLTSFVFKLEKVTMTSVSDSRQTTVMTGSDIVVKSLVDHGVEVIFAYPGGCSMPLHQSLTKYQDKIRTILPRHEQGGAFAAQGYARSTGRIGVAMATSGPGATNLVTSIADAKLDSIPLLAITGQVPTAVIGSDAFQETPMSKSVVGSPSIITW